MKTVREEAITQLLRARLCSDVRTCGQTIDVAVEDDHVYLLGVCDTEEQRAAALMIAQGTHGVRDVHDRIRIRRERVLLAA